MRRWAYTPGERNFELGFHNVTRCWGRGFAIEAAQGALGYAWRELQLAKVYAGHYPDNHASRYIVEGSASPFSKFVFHEPTGLMHPSYICTRPAQAGF